MSSKIHTKWFRTNIFKSASGGYRWAIVQGDTAVAGGMSRSRERAREDARSVERVLVKRYGTMKGAMSHR